LYIGFYLFDITCFSLAFNLDDYVLFLVVVPVNIYANTDTQKLGILKENKDRCGIYR
jgi:hypothetical protein